MKKLAVITGGTKGIGKALVKTFAAEGFDVATCARNQHDLHALQQEVAQAFPDTSIHIRAVDVADKKAIQAFGQWVLDLGQGVEVLVNNAGLFIPGRIHEEEDGVLETMINTNLYSAYHLTRALVGSMKSQQQGHIFNMCSTASITAYENGGSYGISKFALLGMSKVLREEMKPHGVRVTSVIPGATYTYSWEGTDLPEERFMKAEDVADMVLAAYRLSARAVVEELLIRPMQGDL